MARRTSRRKRRRTSRRRSRRPRRNSRRKTTAKAAYFLHYKTPTGIDKVKRLGKSKDRAGRALKAWRKRTYGKGYRLVRVFTCSGGVIRARKLVANRTRRTSHRRVSRRRVSRRRSRRPRRNSRRRTSRRRRRRTSRARRRAA